MAILKKKPRRTVIDLTGPDGNAFFLIGSAMKLARQLDLDGKVIQEEMESGDYENLITVFDKYFGEYILSLNITPNMLNFFMLSLAIILHKNFSNFLNALEEAIKGTSGILIMPNELSFRKKESKTNSKSFKRKI